MGPGNDLAVRCVLRIGDGLCTGYMHRMIMEAYHGPDLRHVKHLDGNLLNLRWKGDKPRPPVERLPIWWPEGQVAGGTVAVK